MWVQIRWVVYSIRRVGAPSIIMFRLNAPICVTGVGTVSTICVSARCRHGESYMCASTVSARWVLYVWAVPARWVLYVCQHGVSTVSARWVLYVWAVSALYVWAVPARWVLYVWAVSTICVDGASTVSARWVLQSVSRPQKRGLLRWLIIKWWENLLFWLFKHFLLNIFGPLLHTEKV